MVENAHNAVVVFVLNLVLVVVAGAVARDVEWNSQEGRHKKSDTQS